MGAGGSGGALPDVPDGDFRTVFTGPGLLFLADGRLPAGGYAHSGGLEEAVQAGRARTVGDLAAFLAGRLSTLGRADAHLAGAAWGAAPGSGALVAVDAEAAARCPSPALRRASRAQGRGLVRTAVRVLADQAPGRALAGQFPNGPMTATAMGAVGRAFDLTLPETTLWAAQSAVSGPAWAATRLLGLDPFAVAGCIHELGGAIADVAAQAADAARDHTGLAQLPAGSAPLLEIGAQLHDTWEVRLFAS